MFSDLFQRAAEQLDIVDVARWLGLTPDRNNKACCPFHSERTASFFLNADKRLFKCFGCGAGGDAIKLTAQLKDITPLEALKLLNEKFRLGLELDRPARPSAAERRAEILREQERANLKAYQSWLDMSLKKLCEIAHTFILWRSEYAPKPDNEIPPDKRFMLAVKNIDTVEALYEDLAARDSYKIKPSPYFDDVDITKTIKTLHEAIYVK